MYVLDYFYKNTKEDPPKVRLQILKSGGLHSRDLLGHLKLYFTYLYVTFIFLIWIYSYTDQPLLQCLISPSSTPQRDYSNIIKKKD